MRAAGAQADARRPRRPRATRGIVLVVLMLSWCAAALALDLAGDRPVPSAAFDAIVVAGAGVMPDGTPSRPLRGRVVRAVELYRLGLAPRVLMTGGVGRNPPAESVVAAQLARTLGVSESALLLDERSRTTEENAIETARLLGRDARILLVTDRFHVLRAERVFRRHVASVTGVGSVCHPWPRFRGAMREVLAVAGYAALGRL